MWRRICSLEMECRPPLHFRDSSSCTTEVFLARDVQNPDGGDNEHPEAVAVFTCLIGGGVPPHYDTRLKIRADAFFTYLFLTRVQAL